ncbi:putative late blight resistance protein homolog R1A-10 [Salvia splendens]|uniref:putative late blight resistance protein homolog R1A-10 n=1 Tax=Salvia splendens TaxID=180675 RepID=UPI001C275DCD|nr:putative late blight resistance protein homolog R1A-10 [Salvia splendens]XP_042039150.1 putative late blight resistance protein homolog R1A-10 [Salvia splendens]
MADAAVTFLLDNLVQLLKHQASLISGAERDLDLLKQDLETLNSFLRKAAKKPNKPEEFRDLEKRIRDVVYEAEDTIDSCIAAAYKKSSITRFFGGFAEEVKSLRENEVIQMVDKVLKFDATTMDNIPDAQRKDSPTKPKLKTIREENVVGFEDYENLIVEYLRESKEELDVISIIGMPGLGKTTLAWKIFKSHFVENEFPNRIWVNVSQTPDIKNVFLTILKKFTSEDISNDILDTTLIDMVQSYLKDRKFILVLDDVWNMEDWNSIRNVLSKSNYMSKVIITSREKSVGDKASQPRKSYELPFLSGPQSWELLQYEAFGKPGMCPDELKVVGECIANNCHGLPLSIVVIGGILVEQDAKNEDISAKKEAWLKVSNDVKKFLENDKKNQVLDIVELSYNRLPDELKDCLLYLAVFPEDYEISAWKLIRLWIGEGFIQGENLEETAEENLKDLISRNLVMVVKRNSKGGVKTCRVHDVVHAFCGSKLLQEQPRFFREMKCVNKGFVPPLSDIDKPRRLSFHSGLEIFFTSNEKKKVSRVRSLLFFKESPNFPEKHTPTMVDGMDLLRVLESGLIKLKQIPKGVTKLFHLRYLTICVDNLPTVAEAFSGLWNLQTLVVYTKQESFTIKANIWKMIHLRHLKTNQAITQVANAKGNSEGCSSLRTLSRISPEICTTNFFNKAPNLKRLGIQGKLAILFKTNSLGMLNQLEKLKLVNTFHDSESQRSMSFPELTSWFPTKLTMLTIVGTRLDWKHMSTLARMEALQVLKLKDDAFTGMSWEAVGGGFHSLHFLLVEDTELVIWKALNNSFPKLRHLVLRQCKRLRDIPDAVVGSLEKLDIEHLSATAVDSAKKIAEKKIANQGEKEASKFKLTKGAGCESS